MNLERELAAGLRPAETVLPYDVWHEVMGGRVLREPGGWWTVEADGRQERCPEYGAGVLCVVSPLTTEEAARVLARATGGRVEPLPPIRYKSVDYPRLPQWQVVLGLGVEGQVGLLNDGPPLDD